MHTCMYACVCMLVSFPAQQADVSTSSTMVSGCKKSLVGATISQWVMQYMMSLTAMDVVHLHGLDLGALLTVVHELGGFPLGTAHGSALDVVGDTDILGGDADEVGIELGVVGQIVEDEGGVLSVRHIIEGDVDGGGLDIDLGVELGLGHVGQSHAVGLVGGAIAIEDAHVELALIQVAEVVDVDVDLAGLQVLCSHDGCQCGGGDDQEVEEEQCERLHCVFSIM
mmetsp:Transcript_17871/g.49563  ORF Transcript_17871/g.49563 Transcript_17871/m.49563 type:complete len:225 (+) Transcript_17871:205-879(+)